MYVYVLVTLAIDYINEIFILVLAQLCVILDSH